MDDLKRYLIEETIEDYEQGRLTRRDALGMLGGLTGAVLGAQLLAACKRSEPATTETTAPTNTTPTPTRPAANSVAADDPAVVAATVQFPSDGATITGYLARPSQSGTFPIVLVCHENRGLTAHIEDVTRRVAKAGYVGLAVDLVSRDGGTAKHAYEDVPGVLGNAPPERHVKDFLAGLAYAKTQPAARGDRVAMTGFCFGGGMTWRVAAALPELRAAVPFYGMPIEPAKVVTIEAAVLAIYAGIDDRINAAIPAIEEAMTKHGKRFEKIVYPNVRHAFHNDTRDRYDATAAQEAWRETLAWLATHLA